MTIKNFQDVLDAIRASSDSTVEQGRRFEELTKSFLQRDPLYASQFAEVWSWGEWAGNRGRHDTGIDLVAKNADDGKFTAVQCKFYAPDRPIAKPDIDTFLSASGTNDFSRRILVSTTDRWSQNAEDTLKNQIVPVARIGIDAFTKSSIDWSQYDIGQPTKMTPAEPKTPRTHQQEAIAAVLENFQTHDRGQLIMACGTGKTYTALQIAEQQVPAGGVILFLAPSITLVSQSLREWGNDASVPMRYHAVCSDAKVGKTLNDEDTGEIAAHDLVSPATTNPETLTANVRDRTPEHRTVIFSTYQSLDVVIAAQQQGLGEIDLIICDEAHRTTGVKLADKDESEFTKVHHNKHISASKRLYMTATPRIFHPDSKSKAKGANAALASMDDQSIYGPEFYRLGFGDAVEQGLLCDYRVLIFGVNEDAVARNVQGILSSDENTLNLDDAAKIIASWNAIAKQKSDYEDFGKDPEPMRRVVAFASRINQSEQFKTTFNATVEEYAKNQNIDVSLKYLSEHVDGRQNALVRASRLEWLKNADAEEECHILSNARCLSEGVDVPALDAVLFLTPRSSQIDVVQAVGRAMRKAPGKKYGYIIIPIAVKADGNYAQSIRDSRYRATWQVLQALKSHDEDFYDTINQSDLKQGKKISVVIFDPPGNQPEPSAEPTNQEPAPIQLPLPSTAIEEIRNAFYARIVDSLTDKHYYRRWAEEVSRINEQYETRISALLDADNPELQADFKAFLGSLQRDLNDGITQNHAVSMLAQHLITKPIFDALFANYRFADANPVSQAMERMTSRLELEHGTASETKELGSFYKSVSRRIRYVEKAEDKQRIIADLYENFFKEALPKAAASLGIIYTPVEAVDYIIHSVEDILQQEFSTSLTNKGIHILDPFVGTGTFLQRLLVSGLIQPHDLARKYTKELHANEFILLAYYIATINIEATYQELVQAEQYTPFEGIVLTDTFESTEHPNAPQLSEDFTRHNNDRLEHQQKQDIRVIIGNPPWSIAQRSQNDDNQNRLYRKLRGRISETYAAQSNATQQRSLYDTYIQAIRWASDLIADNTDGGIVAFITNGGFINSESAEGLRKSLLDEFTKVYCYNLRGNARTSGELRQRENDNVFGGGTQASVAIVILVKKPGATKNDVVRYRDIGDYISREAKLEILADSSLSATEWQTIIPNQNGDWINQRTEGFQELFPLYGEGGIFALNSPGLLTARDAWCYNFSKAKVNVNTKAMIDFFNKQGKTENPDRDPTKFSWSRRTLRLARNGTRLHHDAKRLYSSEHRPFCKQGVYFQRNANEEVSQLEQIYPVADAANLGIVVSEKNRTQLLSCLMTNVLPNYSTLGSTSQYLPRWTYREHNLLSKDPKEHYDRVSNISTAALAKFRRHYADDAISEDDLFYYAYGVLHHQGYREKYAADLAKQPARIPMAGTTEDFRKFVIAGKELADLHLNYETSEPYPLTETWAEDANPEAPDSYRVTKMRFRKHGQAEDRSVIMYNSNITLSGMPEAAYDYRIGQYPALRWLLERYQVKTDKDSGIVNDPNDWCAEQGNPRYIIDLVKRVTAISIRTMEIVQQLPTLPGIAKGETEPTLQAFEQLAEEWERNRPRGGDVAEITAHPAYRNIIDMGEAAVPWILNRLELKPDHWFVALHAITNATPVPPESRGRIKEMTAAWLKWGRQQGYGE